MKKKAKIKPAPLVALLIDMQPHFLYGVPDKEISPLVKNQVKLIKQCGRLDIPVIVVECDLDSATIDVLSEVIRQIPRQGFVEKNWDCAFYRTDLNKILRRLRAETLILMGVNASYCVKKTAKRALSLGYKVVTGASVIGNCDDDTETCSLAAVSRRWWRTNCVFYEGVFTVQSVRNVR